MENSPLNNDLTHTNEENLIPLQPNLDYEYNPALVDNYVQSLRNKQNLPIGILAGLFAALVGATLWALISVTTGYKIGYAAIGLGFLVGFAIRNAGKGIDKTFGYAGALLALFGCVLGDYLSIIGFASKELGIGYFALITSIGLSDIFAIMKEGFGVMDILFYGIAIYSGFKYSIRQITLEEINANAIN